jgi:SulP family sulfate permease
MVAVFGLIDYKEAIHLWKSDRSDFWMLLTTFIATLSLGIEQGIGVGVILSLAMVIFRTTKPHTAVLGQVPGTRLYRNIERFHNIEERQDVLIIRFDAQLYFANVNFFKERMESEIIRKGKKLEHIIIVAESMNNIDSSAIHAIQELLSNCTSKGIKLHFAGVKGPVRDAMAKSQMIEKIGVDNFHLSIQGAINAIDKFETFSSEELKIKEEYTLQVNV